MIAMVLNDEHITIIDGCCHEAHGKPSGEHGIFIYPSNIW
jgi:hypothetical protein